MDLLESDLYILVFCPCRTMTCIRKCCPENKFYDATAGKCDINEDHPVLEKSWRPLMVSPTLTLRNNIFFFTHPLSCLRPWIVFSRFGDFPGRICNSYRQTSHKIKLKKKHIIKLMI